ncbi:mandelate racemase/muconate lactonizing enzyme family protein [Jiangella alba]|uniref:Galactonate dehydratase n=1 Tax=Jiangella alba TaxID=561176 RepID=A0A1H5JI08_9ACTN|nr:mandelate racemase/muconate lactonizing enzyme family protein [Jiangella alba]SEE52100.1 galactonate dehydratase [Jiangella alba]
MTETQIRSVETFILRIAPDGSARPSAGAYYVSAGRPTIYPRGRETLLVRVEAEGGLVGWGECLAPVAPRIPAAIVTDLLVPAMIGEDASHPRPLRWRLGELMRERGHLVGHQADALAAVDIAVWDLAGKASGLSLAQLLGGSFRKHVDAYVSQVPGDVPAEKADSAARLHGQGMRRFKLHLGQGVDSDLAMYDAVVAAVADAQVAVDVHGVYSRRDALRLGAALDERGCWFLESPLPIEDLAGHAELTDRLRTPIATGEALRNRYEVASWLERDAFDILQPDIGRTGITEGFAMAMLANTAFRPVMPHHSTALGVAVAAGLHVAATAEDAHCFEYQPGAVDAGNRLLREPIVVASDGFALPVGPGLGIDVDEAAVRAAAERA